MKLCKKLKESIYGKPITWPDYKCRVIVRELFFDGLFGDSDYFGEWWETTYDPKLVGQDPKGRPMVKLDGRWRRKAKTTNHYGIHLDHVLERIEEESEF